VNTLHRCRRWLAHRCAADSGSAVIEFVFLAVVMLIPLVYLVLMMGRLQAGAYAASAAARESGRVFVTAPDEATALARADAASALALANFGFEEGSSKTVTCSASPCLTPGAGVVTEVRVTVPLPLIPAFVRSVVPLEIPLSSQNVSLVDRFRGAP
jgi:Flp pilus assembly protein TadG